MAQFHFNLLTECYLRHRGFYIWLEPHDGSDLFDLDASFRAGPGIDKDTLSFESINFPKHFIRHENFELKISEFRKEKLFL